MSLTVEAVCLDAQDPGALAGFWGGLLGAPTTTDPVHAGVDLLLADEVGFRLRFRSTEARKDHANRMHLDLTSSSPDQQHETVARALALGARHLDVGQRPEEGHVVLADPDGNELCVIGAGNRFLAGCGFVGALACDGTRAVGVFWSDALGWPLVWDQDEETAIQAPTGGPKISWGGPPVPPRTAPDRVHLCLRTDGDLDAAVEDLIGLGASVVEGGADDVVRRVLADPDGNEFCLG